MTRYAGTTLLTAIVGALAMAGCSESSDHNYGDYTPSVESPTPTGGDDDSSQTGDDDSSQTGDDDSSQTGDDDTTPSGDDDVSQPGDDDSTGTSAQTASIYDLRKEKYPTDTRVILKEAEPITGWSQPHPPPSDYDASKYDAYDFLVNEEDPLEFGGIVIEKVYTKGIAPVLEIVPGDLLTIEGTYRFDDRQPFPLVLLEDESDVSVTAAGATIPAPVPIGACSVAGAEAYFAMRVEVTNVTVDAKTETGFEYDDCLTVSASLFFEPGTAPTFQVGELFDTVTGVPYLPTTSSYPSFALELTSASDLKSTSGLVEGWGQR